MSKRSISDEQSEEHHSSNKKSKTSHDGNWLLDVFGLTPWSTSEISTKLPPLPPISNPQIEQEVFTHPGLDIENNYEILEWIGDSHLEQLATHLVAATFPRRTVGQLSQIREQLVRNATLAEYYRAYRLYERTRLPADIASRKHLLSTKTNDKTLRKIQGDVLEAYVAGILKDDPQNGVKVASRWLKALWGRTIRDQIKEAEALKSARNSSLQTQESGRHNPSACSKDALNLKIVVKGVRVEYRDMPQSGIKKDRNTGLPLYIIGAYLNGWGETDKLLGVGSALSKANAGRMAATRALENKTLMELYAGKKTAFKEAQMEAIEALR